jgi:hypothetical protein
MGEATISSHQDWVVILLSKQMLLKAIRSTTDWNLDTTLKGEGRPIPINLEERQSDYLWPLLRAGTTEARPPIRSAQFSDMQHVHDTMIL